MDMHPDIERIILDRLRNGLRDGNLTAEEQRELDVLIGNAEIIIGKVALKLETAEALILDRGLSDEFEAKHRLAEKEFIRRSLGYE